MKIFFLKISFLGEGVRTFFMKIFGTMNFFSKFWVATNFFQKYFGGHEFNFDNFEGPQTFFRIFWGTRTLFSKFQKSSAPIFHKKVIVHMVAFISPFVLDLDASYIYCPLLQLTATQSFFGKLIWLAIFGVRLVYDSCFLAYPSVPALPTTILGYF